MAPLIKKLQRDQTDWFGQLTQEETAAMETLRQKLILPLLLALLRHGGKYIWDIEACNVRAICVFLQEQKMEQTDQKVTELAP